jgi:hypothetical protein
MIESAVTIINCENSYSPTRERKEEDIECTNCDIFAWTSKLALQLHSSEFADSDLIDIKHMIN